MLPMLAHGPLQAYKEGPPICDVARENTGLSDEGPGRLLDSLEFTTGGIKS